MIYGGHRALRSLSHCGPVDYALDKAYFTTRDLASLEALYRRQPRHHGIAQVQLVMDLG